MKFIKVLFYSALCAIFLTGCQKEKEEPKSEKIKIPFENDYLYLDVQGIDAQGKQPESKQKMVSDEYQIRSFINKLNHMMVIHPTTKESTRKANKIFEEGNYIFTLSDNVSFDPSSDKTYTVYFYDDGTIMFQKDQNEEMIYLSEEKHPTILKDLLELMKIDY